MTVFPIISSNWLVKLILIFWFIELYTGQCSVARLFNIIRRKMILIITGGIGGGKSVAAGMLNEIYGFPVYSADVRVKELYDECPGLLANIEAQLGCSLRDKDGSFVPSFAGTGNPA